MLSRQVLLSIKFFMQVDVYPRKLHHQTISPFLFDLSSLRSYSWSCLFPPRHCLLTVMRQRLQIFFKKIWVKGLTYKLETNIYTGSHWSLWKILLISVGGFLFFKLIIGVLLLRCWLLADKKREINLGKGAIHHKPLNSNIKTDFTLIQSHNSTNIKSMLFKHEVAILMFCFCIL